MVLPLSLVFICLIDVFTARMRLVLILFFNFFNVLMLILLLLLFEFLWLPLNNFHETLFSLHRQFFLPVILSSLFILCIKRVVCEGEGLTNRLSWEVLPFLWIVPPFVDVIIEGYVGEDGKLLFICLPVTVTKLWLVVVNAQIILAVHWYILTLTIDCFIMFRLSLLQCWSHLVHNNLVVCLI